MLKILKCITGVKEEENRSLCFHDQYSNREPSPNMDNKNCCKCFFLTGIVLSLVIAVSLFLISGCATRTNTADLIVSKSVVISDQYKVAILPFKYKYIRRYVSYADIEAPLNANEIVTAGVEREFLRSGKFKVIDREYLLKVLDEQKLSITGLTQKSDLTKIGNLLNADGIIVGEVIELTTLKSVVSLSGRCTMTMKLIDIKSGEIVLTFEVDEKAAFGDYIAALQTAMNKLYTEINKKF